MFLSELNYELNSGLIKTRIVFNKTQQQQIFVLFSYLENLFLENEEEEGSGDEEMSDSVTMEEEDYDVSSLSLFIL